MQKTSWKSFQLDKNKKEQNQKDASKDNKITSKGIEKHQKSSKSHRIASKSKTKNTQKHLNNPKKITQNASFDPLTHLFKRVNELQMKQIFRRFSKEEFG